MDIFVDVIRELIPSWIWHDTEKQDHSGRYRRWYSCGKTKNVRMNLIYLYCYVISRLIFKLINRYDLRAHVKLLIKFNWMESTVFHFAKRSEAREITVKSKDWKILQNCYASNVLYAYRNNPSSFYSRDRGINLPNTFKIGIPDMSPIDR